MHYAEKTLTLLKKEVTEIDYKRYIKNLIFLPNNSSETHFVYQASNILIARWIEANFKLTMKHLGEVLTGLTTNIELIVDTTQVQTTKIKSKIQEKSIYNTNINPLYTFNNYVVGESNQFAYTVCKAIVEKNSVAYNPLFIYGDSGLGKTHIVQAIANALKDSKEILYISFETFLNEFISSLKSNTMEKFRSKFRTCDILIIDDIQFISNKESTQDELFFTFNELHSLNKQIIFTADKNPKKIAGLENRLKDRFQMGLVAKIDSLDLDIKLKIIKKIAELNALDLDEDVINHIASNTDNSAREITGILNKIHIYHTLLGEEISLNLAKKALEDTLETSHTVTMEDIVSIVAKELNVKMSEVISKKRNRDVVNVKRISIYISKSLTDNSLREIATYFSFSDHSAVSHALQKITKMIDSDKYLHTQIENLISKITTCRSQEEV